MADADVSGTVAIVAHDAGGAEIISSYARRTGLEGVASTLGPARSIVSRKLLGWPEVGLPEAIARSEWLLCGTSWQSEHELMASRLARAAGKPVVAFLDHWTSYPERFLLGGVTILPDQIWVGDTYAEALAQRTFPATPILNMGNPYLDEIREEIEALTPETPQDAGVATVLYVCEPIAEQALRQHGDARYWGYTEEDALRYFLRRRATVGMATDRIVLRPHPSEAEGKYDWAPHEYGPTVVIGGERRLLNEIAASRAVVGCESMAMVIGLLAGKRVLSSIPPGGTPCSLPHREIEVLRDID